MREAAVGLLPCTSAAVTLRVGVVEEGARSHSARVKSRKLGYTCWKATIEQNIIIKFGYIINFIFT